MAALDGGNVTSDAGALLLREAAIGCGIIDRFAACFTDHRNPDLIEYTVREWLGQRVFGLCLGYEDLNDHDQLRNDPLFCALMERIGADGSRGAAGKRTLNCLELAREDADPSNRYKKIVYDKAKIEDAFPKFFIAWRDKVPKEIVLDLDATDIPLHRS